MFKSTELTSPAFWQTYWASKNINSVVSPDCLFAPIFDQICEKRRIFTSLEIGGFPGYFSIYLRKYHSVKPTLIDRYIDTDAMVGLLYMNNLRSDDISTLKADVQIYPAEPSYDLVFSNGFLEHFENSRSVVRLHVAFLAKGGSLFISIPNFRGLNGLLQRFFHRENLEKHNLDSMDIKKLCTIATQLGLHDVQVHYYGTFGIWLENELSRWRGTRILMSLLRGCLGIPVHLCGLESKVFSPWIILTALK